MGVGFATVALAGAAAVALPGAAGADTLPDNCTAYTPPLASTRVTCEFDYTGAAQAFHVPDGVSELDVTAVGGQGASSNALGSGGVGAVVDGTIDVDPGADLGVYVGGDGSGNAGGFNGGGDAGDLNGNDTYAGGGGGGGSDVRTGTGLDTRLIVAGGGGGYGNYNSGGAAGEPGSGDGGGQPGSGTAGGAGGGDDVPGGDGAWGVGGTGASPLMLTAGGGGGGGGLYGGGGGGGASTQSPNTDQYYYGGGGGGSSLVPEGGNQTLAGEDEAPSVTISYTICTGSVCQLAGSLGNLFGS